MASSHNKHGEEEEKSKRQPRGPGKSANVGKQKLCKAGEGAGERRALAQRSRKKGMQETDDVFSFSQTGALLFLLFLQ